MNIHRIALACVTLITAICCTTALAQTTVERIQSNRSIIAAAIWAGDTLYVSGPLPAPTPADPAKGKADFADMNDAYRQFFGSKKQPNKPVQAMIITHLVVPNALVDIEVVAVKPK